MCFVILKETVHVVRAIMVGNPHGVDGFFQNDKVAKFVSEIPHFLYCNSSTNVV